ncbi:MAG: hypothetical protein U0174_25405 [Polyangiaceae bacterium]
MGQLPLAWMGVLALAILWTNALLVFFAAFKDLALLGKFTDAAKGIRAATVKTGGGQLARFEIEQVGRAADATDVRTILFHDKHHGSVCLGGTLALDDDGEVEVSKDDTVDVWVSRDAIQSSLRKLEVPGEYAKAYESATKGVGFSRTVSVSLDDGEKIFTWMDGETRVLSNFDPRSLLSGHRTSVVLFMLGTLAGAAVVTAVALVPPAFGLVSKIGGALGLGYFLGITPLGVSLREKIRKPSVAFLRGAWIDPEGRATPQRASASSAS